MIIVTNKTSWFTLIELIVVITILWILATIAFFSYQWYTQITRDSKRISDISTISKSLELYKIKTWLFPEVTDWYNVTFSWELVWTQWFFWENNFTNVQIINKLPIDPLTWQKYIYSVTNKKNEYSLASISEWAELLWFWGIPHSYANSNKYQTMIKWNYNWLIASINYWTGIYILAVPSIISSTWTTLEYIYQNNKFVFDNYTTLPFNYSNILDSTLYDDYNFVNPDKAIVYSWSLNNLLLETNDSYRQQMILNVKQAYNQTEISNNNIEKDILDINDLNIKKVCFLWRIITNNNLWWNVSLEQDKYCLEEWVFELPDLPPTEDPDLPPPEPIPEDPDLNIIFENDNWNYTCSLCD